jgi:hypothetical protein
MMRCCSYNGFLAESQIVLKNFADLPAYGVFFKAWAISTTLFGFVHKQLSINGCARLAQR